MYICRKILEVIIMETLTIKPPKGVSLSDAKIALERLNFEIIDDQEYTISDAYRKELHNRLREWELSPETENKYKIKKTFKSYLKETEKQ